MTTAALDAFDRAIQIVGGQTELARQLAARTGRNIRQGSIWSWRHRTKRLPPDIAPYIEAITSEKGSRIGRAELCPDFPWDGVHTEASA